MFQFFSKNKNSKFKPFSQEKLNEIFNKTWNEFKADPKNSKIIEDPNLAEFSQILEQVTKDTFYKVSLFFLNNYAIIMGSN